MVKIINFQDINLKWRNWKDKIKIWSRKLDQNYRNIKPLKEN